MTIYTAIVGPYEELKEPAVITPGWKYVCYTDQNITSDTWEVRKIAAKGDPRRLAREIKILPHKYIEDDHSLWIDGSFLISCDLNQWWKKFKGPITCVIHPYRNCVYKEAEACIKHSRDRPSIIEAQTSRYRSEGLPANNGVIGSGLLMRQHNAQVIQMSELWHKHLVDYSVRDQISFAYASWKYPIHHLISWDYRTAKEFIHIPHFHKRLK